MAQLAVLRAGPVRHVGSAGGFGRQRRKPPGRLLERAQQCAAERNGRPRQNPAYRLACRLNPAAPQCGAAGRSPLCLPLGPFCGTAACPAAYIFRKERSMGTLRLRPCAVTLLHFWITRLTGLPRRRAVHEGLAGWGTLDGKTARP